MDRYQIVMKNAFTGEEVYPAMYCNGFAVITAVGDEGGHDCCTQGEFKMHDIATVEIAGVMSQEEHLLRAVELVNEYNRFTKERSKPINRAKRWVKNRLQSLDAWLRGEETREESA